MISHDFQQLTLFIISEMRQLNILSKQNSVSCIRSLAQLIFSIIWLPIFETVVRHESSGTVHAHDESLCYSMTNVCSINEKFTKMQWGGWQVSINCCIYVVLEIALLVPYFRWSHSFDLSDMEHHQRLRLYYKSIHWSARFPKISMLPSTSTIEMYSPKSCRLFFFCIIYI